jgi:hypothetical protein
MAGNSRLAKEFVKRLRADENLLRQRWQHYQRKSLLLA